MMENELLHLLKPVRAFMFDFDGVISNGNMLLTEDGAMLRQINVKDSFALNHAMNMRYNIAIVSGSDSEAIKSRMIGLGINDLYLNEDNKAGAMEHFIIKHGLSREEVIYMGDDVVDIGAMLSGVIPICPKDAIHEVKMISKYITSKEAGCGAVREVIEMVLKIHDNWQFLPSILT